MAVNVGTVLKSSFVAGIMGDDLADRIAASKAVSDVATTEAGKKNFQTRVQENPSSIGR